MTAMRHEVKRTPSADFLSILENEQVSSVFQPIVDLRTLDIIGYEALSRGPADTEWHSPVALIEEATRAGMLWKLELLFRKKAIRRASETGIEHLLFLNVDPNVIHDPKFQDGLTGQVVKENGLRTEQIVFEITERSAIDHYGNFKSAIDHYKNQGYKIAIDDTGAGYSNLNAICHIHPGFIKIDMELIRDIDSNSFKQAVVKSFVVLANMTGSKLIAEGIETMEEAKTLISIGVHAGQGYLLGRPSPTPQPVDPVAAVALRFLIRAGTVLHAYNTRLVGEIGEAVPPVQSSERCDRVKRMLDEGGHEGACVIEAGRICGLVMRNRLNESLSRQYGYSLYANRPIDRVMSPATLVVDYSTPIGAVTEMALSREGQAVYDNIIVSRHDKYESMVSVISLLQHAMEIERSYALELNPLTGLPGNVQINRVLLETIRNGMEMCLLYFDLDNFKVYNDLYGFEQGDAIIKLLKDILCGVIKNGHSCASFVGHIGGDDFIAVLTCPEEECREICRETLNRFDREVMSMFTEEHRKAGGIVHRDRMDRMTRFPLTSLSIASVHGCMDGFDTPEALAFHVAGLKKMAKSVTGSCWVMERLENGTILMGTGSDEAGLEMAAWKQQASRADTTGPSCRVESTGPSCRAESTGPASRLETTLQASRAETTVPA